MLGECPTLSLFTSCLLWLHLSWLLLLKILLYCGLAYAGWREWGMRGQQCLLQKWVKLKMRNLKTYVNEKSCFFPFPIIPLLRNSYQYQCNVYLRGFGTKKFCMVTKNYKQATTHTKIEIPEKTAWNKNISWLAHAYILHTWLQDLIVFKPLHAILEDTLGINLVKLSPLFTTYRFLSQHL